MSLRTLLSVGAVASIALLFHGYSAPASEARGGAISRDGQAAGMARYQIRFQTGNIDDAGTDADILLKIHGADGGVTEETRFGIDADFEKGQNTLYERTLTDVGAIASIEIRRADSRSPKPGWYCTFVRVRNLATNQGAVWFVIGGWVSTNWTPRLPTTPSDVLSISFADRIYVNPATPGEAWVDNEHPGLDRDVDTLKDTLEFRLADHFRPVWQFSSREPKADVQHVIEPLTLYQVRSIYWEGLQRLAIRYTFVMAEDEGYTDGFCRGGDWHDGDAEHVEFIVETPDKGVSWSLIAIRVGDRAGGWMFDRTLSPDSFAGIEWWEEPPQSGDHHSRRYHPKIFLSAGKHHPFLDPAFDDDDSPYSNTLPVRIGGTPCNDRIDRNEAGRLADLTSLRALYAGNPRYASNNVGEEYAPLVTDFRLFWGDPPIVHGCGHDVDRCRGSMHAWSGVDFMSDGHVEWENISRSNDGGSAMRGHWLKGQAPPSPTPAEYMVLTVTGDEQNAGTRCPVELKLVGADGETQWMAVGNEPGHPRGDFEPGTTGRFWIGDAARNHLPVAVPRIARIRLDCAGARLAADSWHAMSMIIVDETMPKRQYTVAMPSWVSGAQIVDYPVHPR
jgi:hypothetical protein